MPVLYGFNYKLTLQPLNFIHYSTLKRRINLEIWLLAYSCLLKHAIISLNCLNIIWLLQQWCSAPLFSFFFQLSVSHLIVYLVLSSWIGVFSFLHEINLHVGQRMSCPFLFCSILDVTYCHKVTHPLSSYCTEMANTSLATLHWEEQECKQSLKFRSKTANNIRTKIKTSCLCF